MNPRRPLAAAFALLVLACPLSAHPGHDHSDIPAVLRHPFAGWDHAAIAAVVLAVVGAALFVVARAARFAAAKQPLRVTGAGLLGTALVLAFV